MKTTLIILILFFAQTSFSQESSAIYSDSTRVLSLDGRDDFISIPTNNLKGANTYTIEMWVKPTAFKTDIHLWESNLDLSKPSIEGTSTKLEFLVGNIKSIWTNDLELNKWYHIAATYNKTTTTQSLYVNGELMGQNNIDVDDIIGDTLYIGDRQAKGGYQSNKRHFPGKIDEIRLWNIARTQKEIRNSMHTSLLGDENGLIIYLPCNEGSGFALRNLSTNNNQGILHNMDDSNWVNEKNKLENKHQLEKRQIYTYMLIVLSITALFIIIILIRSSKLKQKIFKEEQKRLKSELENKELKEKRLQESMSFKEKELTATLRYLSDKNEILSKVRDRLNYLLPAVDNEKLKPEFKSLQKLISKNLKKAEDWSFFKQDFEKIHKHFFKNLSKEHPSLNENDLKHCAYARVKLSNKAIANLLNISIDGVKMAKKRIKKKINLSPEDSLLEFVEKY